MGGGGGSLQLLYFSKGLNSNWISRPKPRFRRSSVKRVFVERQIRSKKSNNSSVCNATLLPSLLFGPLNTPHRTVT